MPGRLIVEFWILKVQVESLSFTHFDQNDTSKAMWLNLRQLNRNAPEHATKMCFWLYLLTISQNLDKALKTTRQKNSNKPLENELKDNILWFDKSTNVLTLTNNQFLRPNWRLPHRNFYKSHGKVFFQSFQFHGYSFHLK